jgi:hypothetical protein
LDESIAPDQTLTFSSSATSKSIRRNRPNPDGRARGPAKPAAARRDRGGFPRFLDESIALVELSKRSERARVETVVSKI